MILNGLKKLVGVKKSVGDFFSGLSYVLSIKDKIDDDLDNDGKSQLQNVWEKLVEAEEITIACGKSVIELLKEASKLALELQAHALKRDE